MLSRFFKTRKPVHYLICFILAGLLGFWVTLQSVPLDGETVACLFAVLLGVALVQYIALKNNLTGNHSYVLWLYALLSVLGLLMMEHSKHLLAFIFFLLALRRTLSLRSGRQPLRKIFDSSLWITLAGLLFPWSSLFFVVIYIAIMMYASNNYRYWIAPLLAIACVLCLSFSLDYLIDTGFTIAAINGFQPDYFFSDWENGQQQLIQLSLIVLGCMSALGLFFQVTKTSLDNRSKFSLLGIIALTAVVIAVLTGVYWFLLPTASIFLGRVIRKSEFKLIKEGLLVLPLIVLLLLLLPWS
ncbi:DUF6427 family protein [Nonlabens xiamenensis]|uniref:DUF6427 family protein n=1 Tax=Nonlabens xiamenensis TaxID=2341043 RepID=UPI000F6071AC|nr:DUF6427 family protein [Nonlabens xiamenensis]